MGTPKADNKLCECDSDKEENQKTLWTSHVNGPLGVSSIDPRAYPVPTTGGNVRQQPVFSGSHPRNRKTPPRPSLWSLLFLQVRRFIKMKNCDETVPGLC